MSEKAPQTFANHRRLDPAYHFVAFALFMLVLVMSVIRLVRTPSLDSFWELALSIGLMILLLKLRTYALHNQDRLIRLEETLRMEHLLPGAMRPRIAEMKPGQFVSLRFASDEELPLLVEQTLAEDLDREAIKKRIKVWRPDTFRI